VQVEEKRYDVQAVKDRLNAYREGEREIETQTEVLDRLVSKLEGVGAKIITDMPRSPSPPTDRMTDLIAQKIELEEMIAEDIAFQTAERREISGVLKKLKSADEKAVIRFRYMIGMNWLDVTNAMFGTLPDYLDKELSYQRRVQKIHGRALLHMATIMDLVKS